MKAIGRVVYGDPRTYGFMITRRWAIPEDYPLEATEMWWDRVEWLWATNEGLGDPVFIDVYEGGQSFMRKVIKKHEEKGWKVVTRYRQRFVPFDVVLDRALYTG